MPRRGAAREGVLRLARPRRAAPSPPAPGDLQPPCARAAPRTSPLWPRADDEDIRDVACGHVAASLMLEWRSRVALQSAGGAGAPLLPEPRPAEQREHGLRSPSGWGGSAGATDARAPPRHPPAPPRCRPRRACSRAQDLLRLALGRLARCCPRSSPSGSWAGMHPDEVYQALEPASGRRPRLRRARLGVARGPAQLGRAAARLLGAAARARCWGCATRWPTARCSPCRRRPSTPRRCSRCFRFTARRRVGPGRGAGALPRSCPSTARCSRSPAARWASRSPPRSW